MTRLIYYSVCALAVIGLLAVVGYLKARREPESAEWFWEFSKNLMTGVGLLGLLIGASCFSLKCFG